VLVFCYKYGKLNGQTKLAKLLTKKAAVLNSEKLRDYKVADWIKSYIIAKGYGISELATQLIADHIGNNLERLSNEIDKMLINHPKEALIDEETVEKNIGISKDYNVFELQNAIINRDVLKANRIVKYFGANPREHNPIPVIALMFSLFNKILLAHQAKDKSPQGLAKLLKVNPYFTKDYLTAIRNFPLYTVKNNIRYIHEADMAVKGVDSPTISAEGILKQLVFKLIH
ncbi:MAG: DNA polymerase III subunit delta, partial [Desulfobulbia bacterium]